MIRSRLDLYKKPGDEAVDDDPAYQDYPDVSLQPNVKASSFKPSEEPTIDKLRDELPDFLKPFYGEPGGLNLASAFQGIGQALLPGQKVLTPEDERNLIGVQLEDAMAKKARECIAPQIEGTGRFAEQKIAGLVDKDIGGREFSRTKAFLQDIQTPVLESVRDLAEGRPIYDFSPIELTDLVFSVVDQIDVLGLGTLSLRGLVKGLSSASQSLLNKIQSAPNRAAKIEIARMNPRTTMLLRQELNRAQQMRETTENLASQQGDAFEFLAEPEMRDVRNLTGKPVRPTGKGGQSREYIDYRNSQTNKLVDIIKQNKPEDQNLSLNELIAKYDIQEQFDKSEPGRLKLKGPVRKILKEQLGKKQYEDLYKLAMAKGRTKRSDANTLQLLQVLKTVDDETFESKTAMAQSLADRGAGIDSTNIIARYNKDENVRTLMDQFINPSDPSGRSKDVFNRVFKDANDQQLDNFFNVPLSQINPNSMAQIQDLIKRMGIKDFKSERKLLRSFLYDRYRSIKGSKGNENLTEKDFLNRKYSQEQIDDMQEQFENYIDVERDRLYLQIVGRKVLEELSQNPRYKPYVQSLLKPDELDELIVRGNKTHDQPMFVTRVKGKNRLKKTGRLVNTGTEPEFLNAHFQPYNRLQVDLDPTTSKIADVMTEKGLKQKLEKMPVNVIKTIQVKGKYRTPTSRTNFISEGILEILKDRGVNIDPSKYDNQYQLIKAVHDGIQKIYKDRLIRTVVPTLKGSKRTNYIFGVENPKEFTMDEKIENHIENLVKTFENAIENNISPEELRTGKGYMKLRKGGPVKMAIGGDPLTNLNQQQFAPDPAFNEDFFDQAVDSGQLTAFNPIRLFNIFGKTKGVVTDSDTAKTMLPSPGTTDELTPAPISPVDREDFPFQSFTYEKLKSPNSPNAAKPQDWANFLTGGQSAPISEIRESGLEQYLTDFEKYFPGKKMTKQQLIDFYETSPIGNLEITVKQKTPDAENLTSAELDYFRAQGRPKHQNAGNLSLDNVGQNYREIVVKAGPIPGDTKPFVESGHFDDKNVIAFTRVADYASPDGSTIATIQELQTDMLTSLRKEQERLKAMVQRVDNIKARLQEDLLSTDPYKKAQAERNLQKLDQFLPPNAKELLLQSNAVKPFPNTAGRDLIPQYSEQITNLQKIIDDELAGMIAKDTPEINQRIFDTSQQQLKIRDDLLDLNRALETEDTLKNIMIPNIRQSDDLNFFAQGVDMVNEYDLKKINLFPMVPFQKQKDYVDLILKATIKDAQARGINKVGIFSGDLVNRRWSKDPTGPAGKKFNDLYSKVAVQQMNNIAKKYGGNVQIESIINPDNSDRGLTYFKRDLDGGFSQLKQDQLAQGLGPEEAQLFIDEQLSRNAHSLGANQVIYLKEIAPGQTMDYYVQPKTISDPTDTGGFIDTKTFDLVPLGPGDDRNAAQIIIEEYNPQEIKIPVLTLPLDEPKAKGPFFLFGKKDGGKISSDGLVSITNIYGEY